MDSLYTDAVSSVPSNVAILEDTREDHAEEVPQWEHQNAEQKNNTEQELSCNSPSV